MTDYETQRKLEKNATENTSSFKKTMNYIDGLLEDANFQKEVSKLRKRYKLPKKGLPETMYGEFNGGKYIEFPEQVANGNFYPEVVELCEKYALDLMWSGIFENYIVYNNTDIRNDGKPIEIVDFGYLMNGPFQYKGEEDNIDYFKNTAKTHPVAIFINPYASQREITDYIRKLYKISIEPIQDSYKSPKIKLGRVKKKKAGIKERNDFIYKNRYLPRKKIMELITDTFGPDITIDYGYIGKIISKENRKRKDM